MSASKTVGCAVALAVAFLATGAAARAATVEAVLEADVAVLDPHYTTAYPTRTFGYMVFDTLFGTDGAGQPKPQMVASWTVSEDRLRWTFTLRDGLLWHDGRTVTAADCVASLRRWASRNAMGGRLMAVTASLETLDAKSFVLILREPYGLVLETLATTSAPGPFMLPERLASRPGNERLSEVVGSGPFVFEPAGYVPGNRMKLLRNQAYSPRKEAADFLAGGKHVHLDAVEIKVIPDGATAVAALQSGEVDYLQYPPFDLIPVLEKNRDIRVQKYSGMHMFSGQYRINLLAKPFDDPAIRRVLQHLVDQREVLTGLGLEPDYIQTCYAFFTCGSPYESRAGTEGFGEVSVEAAAKALRATAYRNEPVTVVYAADLDGARISTEILADRMRRAGFNVDLRPMDLASQIALRSRHDGWTLYGAQASNMDLASPLTNSMIAGNCMDSGGSGYACFPALTSLLDRFGKSASADERRNITADIQKVVYDQGMIVPWGQFSQPSAMRTRLRDVVPSSIPIFWEMRKD